MFRVMRLFDRSCAALGGRLATACLTTFLGLAGCAAPPAEVAMYRAEAPPLAASAGLGAPRSHDGDGGAMAADFLELAFRLESGRELMVLSRFEGPISVRVTGRAPPTAGPDLARLIARLRREAGIDIAMAPRGRPAAITIEFQPRAALRRLAPMAACFVVPGASSLAEFRRSRGGDSHDWSLVRTRTRAAIFVPSDTSPQEVRDCLHEELAQAIGPLNDLYRLPDSVFNDDNFHTVLTGFDMAILRAYMAPELRSGMTRDAVAAVLPAVLARTGAVSGGWRGTPSTRAWLDAIQGAISGGASLTMRRADAARAVGLAQGMGWRDARAAFSHFALARLEVSRDPALAARHFDRAEALWAGLPGTAIHRAHVELQRATMALAAGDAQTAIARANRALPALVQAQNAALQATALLVKSEAMAQAGRLDEAARLRLDSRELARYGFGTGSDVETRVHEIAAQSRRAGSN